MAKLTAAARKKIPAKEFGEPGKRKYPMPDKSHAANAKARAKQQLKKGNLSEDDYKRVVAKADKMLGSSEPDSDDDRADLYIASRYRRREDD